MLVVLRNSFIIHKPGRNFPLLLILTNKRQSQSSAMCFRQEKATLGCSVGSDFANPYLRKLKQLTWSLDSVRFPPVSLRHSVGPWLFSTSLEFICIDCGWRRSLQMGLFSCRLTGGRYSFQHFLKSLLGEEKTILRSNSCRLNIYLQLH